MLVIPQPRRRMLVRPGLLGLGFGLALAAAPREGRAGLDEYVRKRDTSFAWSQTSNHNTPAGTINSIALTSQIWQGIAWTHDLRIYEPREIVYPDTVLLFITGGSADSKPSENDHKQAFGLAQLCGARV